MIIGKLPLEKSHTYLTIFLKLKVDRFKIILIVLSYLPMTSDSMHKIFCLHLIAV